MKSRVSVRAGGLRLLFFHVRVVTCRTCYGHHPLVARLGGVLSPMLFPSGTAPTRNTLLENIPGSSRKFDVRPNDTDICCGSVFLIINLLI